MSLLRSSALVGLAAGLSRILGFVRDVAIAGALGAGPAASALLAALQAPNAVRRTLSEGGLNAGFVPLYADLRERGGPAAAGRFAGQALTGFALALLALTALVEVGAGALALLLAAGYADDPGTLDLLALYLRLAFPFVAGAALASLVAARLNAERRFLAAALGPLLTSPVVIGAILVAGRADPAPETLGAVVAAAVAASGFLHLAVVGAAARRLPGGLGLARPRLSPEVRRLVRTGLPLLAAAGAAQLMVLAAVGVASFTPSGVAWLYYADRLFQLPLGFVASGVGLVLLPEIAGRIAGGDRAGAGAAQNRALEGSLLLALPAACALALLAEPIARVLFVRGAFTEADASGVAAVLAGLSAGLAPAAVAKVLQQGLFATGRGGDAVRAGTLGIVATAAGALLLQGAFGPAGLGLGVALGLAVQAASLARAATQAGLWRPDRRLALQAARAAAASLAMAAALVGAGRALGAVEAGLPGAPALAALVAAGLAAYGVAAAGLGALRGLKAPEAP